MCGAPLGESSGSRSDSVSTCSAEMVASTAVCTDRFWSEVKTEHSCTSSWSLPMLWSEWASSKQDDVEVDRHLVSLEGMLNARSQPLSGCRSVRGTRTSCLGSSSTFKRKHRWGAVLLSEMFWRKYTDVSILRADNDDTLHAGRHMNGVVVSGAMSGKNQITFLREKNRPSCQNLSTVAINQYPTIPWKLFSQHAFDRRVLQEFSTQCRLKLFWIIHGFCNCFSLKGMPRPADTLLDSPHTCQTTFGHMQSPLENTRLHRSWEADLLKLLQTYGMDVNSNALVGLAWGSCHTNGRGVALLSIYDIDIQADLIFNKIAVDFVVASLSTNQEATAGCNQDVSMFLCWPLTASSPSSLSSDCTLHLATLPSQTAQIKAGEILGGQP